LYSLVELTVPMLIVAVSITSVSEAVGLVTIPVLVIVASILDSQLMFVSNKPLVARVRFWVTASALSTLAKPMARICFAAATRAS
jgi:hypothetical protein